MCGAKMCGWHAREGKELSYRDDVSSTHTHPLSLIDVSMIKALRGQFFPSSVSEGVDWLLLL